MCVERMVCSAVSVAVVLISLSAVAHADLILQEQFDYATAEWLLSTTGETANTGLAGGIGFAPGSEWGVYSGEGGALLRIVPGLQFGQLTTSGNALGSSNVTGSAIASRATGVTVPTGTTLWTSFLWRWDSAGGMAAHSSITQDQFGTQFRRLRILPDTSEGNARISDGTNNLDANPVTNLKTGSTYLLIAKNTNIGEAGAGSLWVLSEAGFGDVVANGHDEAALDAYSLAKATGSLGSNTLNSPGPFLQLASIWGASTFDEFRMGTTLDAVTPIPEPTTLMILLCGLFGFLGFAPRRRRKADG